MVRNPRHSYCVISVLFQISRHGIRSRVCSTSLRRRWLTARPRLTAACWTLQPHPRWPWPRPPLPPPLTLSRPSRCHSPPNQTATITSLCSPNPPHHHVLHPPPPPPSQPAPQAVSQLRLFCLGHSPWLPCTPLSFLRPPRSIRPLFTPIMLCSSPSRSLW